MAGILVQKGRLIRFKMRYLILPGSEGEGLKQREKPRQKRETEKARRCKRKTRPIKIKVLQTKDVEGGQMRGLKKLTEREREMGT